MTKKQLEKEVSELKAKLKKAPKHTHIIKENNITGVHWDADALSSVEKVAEGLLNMTELFKGQEITFGIGIQIAADDVAVLDTKIKN